jgi:hypothetical protein
MNFDNSNFPFRFIYWRGNLIRGEVQHTQGKHNTSRRSTTHAGKHNTRRGSTTHAGEAQHTQGKQNTCRGSTTHVGEAQHTQGKYNTRRRRTTHAGKVQHTQEKQNTRRGSTTHAAPTFFGPFQKHYRKTGRTVQSLLSNGAKWNVKNVLTEIKL